jgi:hypothetical protein
MQWKISGKRTHGEVITISYRGIEPRDTAADPAFSDFNYPLPPQDSPGSTRSTGLAVLPLRGVRVDDEDAEDLQDARNALNEPGERSDYEDFRRGLGLE